MTESANELLGFIIDNMDENNECAFSKILERKEQNLNLLIEELVSYGYIKREIFECVKITPLGMESYVSDSDVLNHIATKESKKIASFLIGIIGTVIGGIIVGWFTYHFFR